MKFFSNARTFALDLLFPDACVSCVREGKPLCESCERILVIVPPTCIVCKKFVPAGAHSPAGQTCAPCRKKTKISVFLSPAVYESKPTSTIIHALKYRRVRSLAPEIARILECYIERFRVQIPERAVFVPIPLHPRRERARGFNQSELIAKELGRKLSIPVLSLISRSRQTRAQATLDYQSRHANLKEAFFARDTKGYKIVILVDDVKTTGATLEDAARALKKAGAKRVWAITFAH